MSKRIVGLLLVICLCVGLLPVVAMADEATAKEVSIRILSWIDITAEEGGKIGYLKNKEYKGYSAVRNEEGEVTGYDEKATAITANEQAAQNRLTVNVKISFVNRKYPEDSFENKSFSAYADFDAMQTLDAVESSLCEEIVEQLCEDIFNGTVANW